MFMKLFRAVFTLCGLLFGYGVASFLQSAKLFSYLGDEIVLTSIQENMINVVLSLIFGLIFYKITPLIRRHGVEVAKNIESDLQKVPANEILSGGLGMIAGLIVAFFISQIIYGLSIPFVHNYYLDTILSILIYLFCAYLGMTIMQKKGRDVQSQWLSARREKPAKGKAKGATPKILDTSVIIDGRIADIMKTGFIEGDIVIPEFVLVELRHIADSSDSLKRNRGRRGLDILNRIQTDYGIEIYNTDAEKALEEIPEVDVKLLKLAQIMNGKVVTNDFNLNKVAMIKGVEVLNINELANTLKPVVLPGEEMQLFLVKEGKENNQAVAYLDDGTMIVVEDGKRFIGKTIDVTVTSVLQTSAGRMIFAKPKR